MITDTRIVPNASISTPLDFFIAFLYKVKVMVYGRDDNNVPQKPLQLAIQSCLLIHNSLSYNIYYLIVNLNA